ncbi:uncharacterized protein LOC111460284 isoform X2 [Cucurbita moschata]|uniref:Uncharacterized protein LOC111460284 isoform X2 n=1 Tax=Cucurbita moschata TaxID=3662 RepID=A0A6J1H4B0_CUCMO|nr:uncharacterized protein LOC111460284 isoform X2 [Cucurbita moschata]
MKNGDSCLFEMKVDFCVVVPKGISEEISSPINAQIYDFCDSELFSEMLQNSEEFNSYSNCYYDNNSSYATNLPHSPDQADNNGNENGNTVVAAPSFVPANDASATTNITTNSNLTTIFDCQEELDNDISASIDFSPSDSFSIAQYLTIQSGQFDISQVQSQMPLLDPMIDGLLQCPMAPGTLIDEDLPSIYVDDCLSSFTSYMPLNPSSPSCSFVGATMPTYLPTPPMNLTASSSSVENCGMFPLLSAELQPQDLDYQGDNCGLYSQDYMQGTFNPADLQVLSDENLQLAAGAMNCTSLASDLSSLKDSTFKVGKLSVEERKQKIHRYMKKRNERNFSKKIKYACRKTLADSRPRVRGRFAKNDELTENHRAACSIHEEEEEEVKLLSKPTFQKSRLSTMVVVKEEDSMVDSSDIFAHISGVNSLKRSYPIQSWI